MKKINTILTMIALSVMTSCSTEDTRPSEPASPDTPSDGLRELSFSAGISAKTVMNSAGSIIWEETDLIGIYDSGCARSGNENLCREFSMTFLSEDKASAVFSGAADKGFDEGEEECYYAIYPYSQSRYDADGYFVANIPTVQTATANSFASGSNISIGRTNTTDMTFLFKNVCGYFKVRFTGERQISSFTIQDANMIDANPTISGGFRILWNNGEPAPTNNKTGANHVTLIAPESQTYIAAETDYYITAIPRAFTNGLRFIAKDKDGNYAIHTNNTPTELLRNQGINLSVNCDQWEWHGADDAGIIAVTSDATASDAAISISGNIECLSTDSDLMSAVAWTILYKRIEDDQWTTGPSGNGRVITGSLSGLESGTYNIKVTASSGSNPAVESETDIVEVTGNTGEVSSSISCHINFADGDTFDDFPTSSQTSSEDKEYTFVYDGKPFTFLFPSGTTYYIKASKLCFDTDGTKFGLPVVKDYRLSSIKVNNLNTKVKNYIITDSNDTAIGSATLDQNGGEHEFTLNNSEIGTRYYLKAGSSSLRIGQMILTYTK